MAKLDQSKAELKARVEELTREVGEREEMLGDDIPQADKISPYFSLLFSSLFFKENSKENIMIFSLIFSFIFFFHHIFHVIQTKENKFSHDFFFLSLAFSGNQT